MNKSLYSKDHRSNHINQISIELHLRKKNTERDICTHYLPFSNLEYDGIHKLLAVLLVTPIINFSLYIHHYVWRVHYLSFLTIKRADENIILSDCQKLFAPSTEIINTKNLKIKGSFKKAILIYYSIEKWMIYRHYKYTLIFIFIVTYYQRFIVYATNIEMIRICFFHFLWKKLSWLKKS